VNRNRKIKEILTCVLVVTGTFLTTSRDTKGDYVYGTPKNLGPAVNSSQHEASAVTSADGLSMVFWSGATWEDPGEP